MIQHSVCNKTITLTHHQAIIAAQTRACARLQKTERKNRKKKQKEKIEEIERNSKRKTLEISRKENTQK